MQGYQLTGSTGFALSNVEESGCAAGSPLGLLDLDCGVTKRGLI
jgi:hypothetical protein